MPELKTHFDVLKVLPKTNCRDCGLKTCLVFAAAVMDGNRKMGDCPHLDPIEAASYTLPGRKTQDEDQRRGLEALQARVAKLDQAEVSARLGLPRSNGGLLVNSLGKNFTVDASGRIVSDCHTNHWIMVPILNYLLKGSGREPTGEWVPFRELPGGLDWGPLFHQRCEKQFKKLLDEYTDLFEFIIDVFSGEPAPPLFDSDLALILHPLPKLPLLICYWKSDGEMDASLNLFFDREAEENLNVESIYTLSVGLVTMFEKIAQTHGR